MKLFFREEGRDRGGPIKRGKGFLGPLKDVPLGPPRIDNQGRANQTARQNYIEFDDGSPTIDRHGNHLVPHAL